MPTEDNSNADVNIQNSDMVNEDDSNVTDGTLGVINELDIKTDLERLVGREVFQAY